MILHGGSRTFSRKRKKKKRRNNVRVCEQTIGKHGSGRQGGFWHAVVLAALLQRQEPASDRSLTISCFEMRARDEARNNGERKKSCKTSDRATESQQREGKMASISLAVNR